MTSKARQMSKQDRSTIENLVDLSTQVASLRLAVSALANDINELRAQMTTADAHLTDDVVRRTDAIQLRLNDVEKASQSNTISALTRANIIKIMKEESK